MHLGYRLCMLGFAVSSACYMWDIDFQSKSGRPAAWTRTSLVKKKKEIQERFRTEMDFLLDIPMQGSGNTNSGNTARKFFKQHELSAEITGVNQN